MMVANVNERTDAAAPIDDPNERCIDGRVTRRTFVAATVAAAIAGATGVSAQGKEATPGATREVVDRTGPVTVPAQPQRVVAEGNSTLGNMLALGVKPVGASMNPHSIPSFLADQIDGIVDLRAESGIDLEKALTLDPDLVIAIWGSGGEGWNMENVERYRRAFTTFAYEQSYVYEEDIKNNVTSIAAALGVEDRAASVLDAYDARVAELRRAVREVGFNDKPVTVVRVFEDGNYSIRIGTSESIVFRAIGIPQPEGQQDPEEFALDMSTERLDILNSAYAVIIYVDDSSKVDPDELLTTGLWPTITPVQENRVIFVNSGVWNSIEMPGVMAIMDDVEELLLPLAQSE